MKTSSPLRAAAAAGTALALGVAFVGPASGADPTPAYSGCGTKYYKGASGGIANQEGQDVPSADIVGAWAELSPTKGPVVEMVINDLSGKVDPPNTSITYDFKFATDADHFVRAYLDYTNTVYFEYGHTDATVPVTTRYVYDGPAKGALYPGKNGIVELALPAEVGAKAGATVKGLTGETQIGETTGVPGAVNQSPSRGLSQQADSLGMGNWLISPCAAGGGGGGGTTTPAPTPGTTTPSTQTGGAFPGSVTTKSVKAAKKGKTIKIKVKSSEALTNVVARLSKGKSELGRGKLAKLNGSGTFKVKLKKALKKGTYALDVTGTDANGRPRPASYKLKVK